MQVKSVTRTYMCDCCKWELVEVDKNREPPGWSQIKMTVNLSFAETIKGTGDYDLCPSCTLDIKNGTRYRMPHERAES